MDIKAGDFVRWVSRPDPSPTGSVAEPQWKIGIVSHDDERKYPIPVIQLRSSDKTGYGDGCLFFLPPDELTVLRDWLSIKI